MSLGHKVSTQVDTGDNEYVQSLLNAGWRWDTSSLTGDSQEIRYAFGSGTSNFTASEENAIRLAMSRWASVADIDLVEVEGSSDGAEINLHLTTSAGINNFGGYSGTPNQALTTPTNDGSIHVGDKGQVHTYFATDGTSTSGGSIFLNGNVTPGGFELIMHEIGHSLGLKHPHDYGSTNYQHLFPGVTFGDSSDKGDNDLNQQLYTIMSYNYPSLAGECATPMAFDIAAIQQLYGARTNSNAGDNTYEIFDSGHTTTTFRNGWQCIWDTGGTDQMVYNGNNHVTIDLRPATLDNSSTGGGVASYANPHSLGGWSGFTIAGDVTNAIANQNGVKGVIIENAQGGGGDDTIRGNDVGNGLNGGGGDDVISGFDGGDMINGQAGHDFLGGGNGDDIYLLYDVVNGAYDFIDESPFPAAGVDAAWVRPVDGGPTSYTLVDNVENGAITDPNSDGFTLNGNDLANKLYDDIGSNAINGGGDDDFIDGGAGNDTLNGGTGSDKLQGNIGSDIFNLFDVSKGAYDKVVEHAGDSGTDTVLVMDVSNAVRSYEMTANVENGAIIGHNASGFSLHGNDLGNKLWDDIGGNWLWGEGGNDRLDGGDGQDFLVGGAGNDTYILNDRTGGVYDQVSEDADGGIDMVQINPIHINGSPDRYFLTSNVERGKLIGSTNFDLYGNSTDNRLFGNAGANTLTGYGGRDRLIGQSGDDVLTGGSGNDTFVFANGFGHDTITDFNVAGNRRLHDAIEFSTSVFADWNDVLAATANTDAGAVITLDGNNSITVAGVTKQSLIEHHESDFLFV